MLSRRRRSVAGTAVIVHTSSTSRPAKSHTQLLRSLCVDAPNGPVQPPKDARSARAHTHRRADHEPARAHRAARRVGGPRAASRRPSPAGRTDLHADRASAGDLASGRPPALPRPDDDRAARRCPTTRAPRSYARARRQRGTAPAASTASTSCWPLPTRVCSSSTSRRHAGASARRPSTRPSPLVCTLRFMPASCAIPAFSASNSWCTRPCRTPARGDCSTSSGGQSTSLFTVAQLRTVAVPPPRSGLPRAFIRREFCMPSGHHA